MIRLLSTDFDGTLVEHFASPPVSPALIELLSELRRAGVLWAVNTGRGLDLVLEGLREFAFPIEPDYILTNEREVFHRNENGEWQDYGDWNRRCAEAHAMLFERERHFLDRVLEFLTTETRAKAIYENELPVGVVAVSDEEMDRVVAYLDECRTPESLFHYQRNTIYLRFCHAHYSKGAALEELCRLTGIRAAETFAAGDHFNDISMLDGRYAKWPCAPANAIESVKETVRAAGGYVAQAGFSSGVAEGLRHFLKQHGIVFESLAKA